MGRNHHQKNLIGFLLTLLWMSLAATAGAQEGQFFRGEERARIIEETQRLAGIQERHEDEILNLPGVLGIGVGLDREKRELVFLVVVDENGQMPDLPQDIEGIPVMVERHPPDVPLHGVPNCVEPCHADQLPLPVEMGNSAFTTNRCSACTMGFKACELATGRQVYVTNSHCSPDASGCVGAAPPGTPTSHVSPSDATPNCSSAAIVGQTIQQFAPLCDSEVDSVVDCASVASTSAQTDFDIRDVGLPKPYHGTVVVGDTVQKSGRTTGYTQGTVVSTNYSVLTGPWKCCGLATFVHQIRVNALGEDRFIGPGDSGSALLNMDDEIVGLLFSGPYSGLAANANPIGSVLYALGLSLDPIKCIDCAAEAAAEETSAPEETLDVLYGIRDSVLQNSAKGQGYIALFYEFSSEVVGLMMRQPELLGRTAGLLTTNLDTLSSLMTEGTATMSDEDVEEISQLLQSYAEIADEDLRQALELLDEDLRNAELLAEFGLYVR